MADQIQFQDFKEHKVATGESLASIAAGEGITWRQLAQFNWGTCEPMQINVCLHQVVGCNEKTRDGKNYIFTDDDDPGIIYIPVKSPQYKLETGATHQIQIVRPHLKVPNYRMTISFLLDTGGQVDSDYPIYILETTDGSYFRKLCAGSDLVTAGDYMQLQFDRLTPGLEYRLTRLVAEDIHEVVFDNAPLATIVDQDREIQELLLEHTYGGLDVDTGSTADAICWESAPENEQSAALA